MSTNTFLFRLLVIITLLGMFACSSSDVEEQEEIKWGKLSLHLSDEVGQHIEGGTISISSKGTYSTSALGTYSCTLPIGEYEVKMSKEGYISITQRMTIKENETTTLDVVLKTGEPILSVVVPETKVLSKKGVQLIEITSNTNWSLSSSASWITFSVDSGAGNKSVMLYWETNAGVDGREAVIELSAGEKVCEIIIQQNPPIRLLKVGRAFGDMKQEEPFTVSVWFSCPVFPKELHIHDSLIWDTWTLTSAENGYRVNFDFPAGCIGREYEFEITVANDEGEKLVQEFVVPFYADKWAIEGEIRHLELGEDDQSFWITTSAPHRFSCLSTENGQIIKSMDLPSHPGTFSYNPYNGYYYVMQTDVRYGHNAFSNKLWVIDPQSMSVVKELVFEPEEGYDHPQHPAIYPQDIKFANDGLGILQLRSYASSGTKWRYIESYNDDACSRYEEDDYVQIYDVFNNYDRSKVVTYSPLWGNQTFSFFDKEQLIPKNYVLRPDRDSDEFFAGGYLMEVRFHRTKNIVFLPSAPLSNCLYYFDEDRYSPVIVTDASGDAEFDYSYTSGIRVWKTVEGNIEEPAHIKVLDMDKGKELCKVRAIWKLNSLVYGVYCLKDNKRMIIPYYNDTECEQYIFVLDIAEINSVIKE